MEKMDYQDYLVDIIRSYIKVKTYYENLRDNLKRFNIPINELWRFTSLSFSESDFKTSPYMLRVKVSNFLYVQSYVKKDISTFGIKAGNYNRKFIKILIKFNKILETF